MISDLFTWLHEYMNEEREGVRMLLIEEDGSDAHFVMSCMDVIFSGANKFVQEFLIPFFEDNSNLVQLFEAMQILAFYENIVASTISPESSLRSTLVSIEQTLWFRITSLLIVRVKHYFRLSPFVSNSFVSSTTPDHTGNHSILTELLLLLRQCFDV